jgi:hypothetical protein
MLSEGNLLGMGESCPVSVFSFTLWLTYIVEDMPKIRAYDDPVNTHVQ